MNVFFTGKQQGHSTLNHDSVTANGKSESTRNKRDKKICESKRHSPQDQKKPTQEVGRFGNETDSTEAP